MRYRLSIESGAKKDLESFDSITQKRIVKKLKFFLSQDSPLTFAKKLVDPNDGDYRWRIGHYRVIFDVEKDIIKVLRVQHRRDVYRR